LKIRRVYQGDDTLQAEVQEAEGQWQPTTPRSALGYDSPFTRRGSSSLTPASNYLR